MQGILQKPSSQILLGHSKPKAMDEHAKASFLVLGPRPVPPVPKGSR